MLRWVFHRHHYLPMSPDEPCQCLTDGYCTRYRRRMVGHLRRICQGVVRTPEECRRHRTLWAAEAGVSLDCPHAGREIREAGKAVTKECGTCPGMTRLKVFECNHPAREPDRVTAVDCASCLWRPRPQAPDARRLILRNYCPPGDVLVMTAAVRSLHAAYPGQYILATDTSTPAIWEHNPNVVPLEEAREAKAEVIDMHYPLVNRSNDLAVHAMNGYCQFMADNLKVPVPLAVNRPLLYLSKREKSWLPQVQEITRLTRRYWVVCAGRKDDFTAKFWGTKNFQRLVDILAGRVFVVQVGSANHHHPRLHGALDLVGKTDIRQLIRLCYHAQGGIGGITFLQHVMAALERPYISIMGGREPAQWNAYPLQQQMHVVGMLDCCRTRACWRSKVYPLASEEKDSRCEQPMPGEEPIPRCMAMISPEEVAAMVLKFSS